MKLGLSPYGLELHDYVTAAAAAERAGFESVWVPDHLAIPAAIGSRFPYSADGESGLHPGTQFYDACVLLSFIAAATSRLLLGTYVYVLPLRHPFVTAKAIGSLDLLSGGRVALGVGAGWLGEEYEALGVDFNARGALTTDAITVIRRLWSDELAAADAGRYRFESVGMSPQPGRTIPILVGGHSAPAVRRAAVLGDGWIGSPRMPSELAAHLAAMAPMIDHALEAAGRSRAQFELTSAIVGEPAADTLEIARDAGLARLIVSPWSARGPEPAAQAVERIEAIAARCVRAD